MIKEWRINEKRQSISLALGGFFALLMILFNRIEFEWIGFLYISFCMIIGFLNWIEIDKLSRELSKEEKA